MWLVEAQNGDRWQVVVNVLMNFIFLHFREFLNSRETISFIGRTLLNGVSCLVQAKLNVNGEGRNCSWQI
jgi:hypothetical protein